MSGELCWATVPECGCSCIQLEGHDKGDGTCQHGNPLPCDVIERDPITDICEALCAADSILSLLHYRHRNELSENNRTDVEAAMKKVVALRNWYEKGLAI